MLQQLTVKRDNSQKKTPLGCSSSVKVDYLHWIETLVYTTRKLVRWSLNGIIIE